MEVNIGKSKRI